MQGLRSCQSILQNVRCHHSWGRVLCVGYSRGGLILTRVGVNGGLVREPAVWKATWDTIGTSIVTCSPVCVGFVARTEALGFPGRRFRSLLRPLRKADLDSDVNSMPRRLP